MNLANDTQATTAGSQLETSVAKTSIKPLKTSLTRLATAKASTLKNDKKKL